MTLSKAVFAEGIKIEIITLVKDETFICKDACEVGIMLMKGNITIELNEEKIEATRSDIFSEFGAFVHKNNIDTCTINSVSNSELVLIKIENSKNFPSKIYDKSSISESVLASPKLTGKDVRTIRDVVNIGMEPNANIIIGEVVGEAGCWSSYPPHSHEQPEIYYYQFNHESGFGVSVVGEEANVVKNGDFSIIPGNLIHPQSCAPGYRMYYLWIIRNLEGNPWTKREFDPSHVHLLEEK